jgi:prevent-host-death family protein
MKVSAAEIGGNFGQLADRAQVEPVSITKNGREHVVLLSAAEYARLVRQDRRAWRTTLSRPCVLLAWTSGTITLTSYWTVRIW